MDVELPRAEARPIDPKEGLILSVNQQGQIFVDEDRTPLSYSDFRSAFQALVSARDPDGVYVRGDRRASYGDVIRVLAVVQAAGIANVGMVLQEEEIRR